jgi:hypothetical protein
LGDYRQTTPLEEEQTEAAGRPAAGPFTGKFIHPRGTKIGVWTGPTAQKLAFEEAQRLENRINELDRLIGSAQKSIPVRPTDTPEIVASVTRQLTELRRTIKDSPLKTLRKVAETFVGRIEFHCESRRVDMEIRLPAWALTRKDDILRRVRTEDSSGNTTAHQPNCENSVILAKTSCAVHSGTGRRKPCVSCSRLAA